MIRNGNLEREGLNVRAARVLFFLIKRELVERETRAIELELVLNGMHVPLLYVLAPLGRRRPLIRRAL